MRKLISTISIFVFISFILVCPSLVMARLADPNLMPQNTPLRPPAENILPNYQNSINAVSESGAETESKIEERANVTGASEKDLDSGQISGTKQTNSLFKISKAWVFGALIVIFIAVLGGVFYLIKDKKLSTKKEEKERQ